MAESRGIRFHDSILRLSTAITYGEFFFCTRWNNDSMVTRQSVTECEGKNENKIVPSRRAITWDVSL